MSDIEMVLAALRHEIQLDRIEIQRTINAGFNALTEKFDEHANSDNIRFDEVNKDVHTLQTISKGMGAIMIPILGAIASWAFSKFG